VVDAGILPLIACNKANQGEIQEVCKPDEMRALLESLQLGA